jgi:hypothetical protein
MYSWQQTIALHHMQHGIPRRLSAPQFGWRLVVLNYAGCQRCITHHASLSRFDCGSPHNAAAVLLLLLLQLFWIMQGSSAI